MVYREKTIWTRKDERIRMNGSGVYELLFGRVDLKTGGALEDLCGPCRSSSLVAPVLVRVGRIGLARDSRTSGASMDSHRFARIRHLYRTDAVAAVSFDCSRNVARGLRGAATSAGPVSSAHTRCRDLPELARMDRSGKCGCRVPCNSSGVLPAIRARDALRPAN
jgi:hypothetical protein